MKALKWVLIVVGAVCLGFGLYMVIRLSMDMRTVMDAANAARGANAFADLRPTLWIVAGIALAAGALLGLGVGLPRRTSGSVRRDALEGAAAHREEAIRENALRRGAAAPSQAPTGPVAVAQAGPEELGDGVAQTRPQLEQGGRTDAQEKTPDGAGDDAGTSEEEGR